MCCMNVCAVFEITRKEDPPTISVVKQSTGITCVRVGKRYLDVTASDCWVPTGASGEKWVTITTPFPESREFGRPLSTNRLVPVLLLLYGCCIKEGRTLG